MSCLLFNFCHWQKHDLLPVNLNILQSGSVNVYKVSFCFLVVVNVLVWFRFSSFGRLNLIRLYFYRILSKTNPIGSMILFWFKGIPYSSSLREDFVYVTSVAPSSGSRTSRGCPPVGSIGRSAACPGPPVGLAPGWKRAEILWWCGCIPNKWSELLCRNFVNPIFSTVKIKLSYKTPLYRSIN